MPGGKKTIVDVRVKDLEKWRYPSKHYVYVLEVTWSEGTKTIIYRRYSRFFEFQCKLLEMFPEEAGEEDPAQRMIPFLPGKKLFSRTNVRKVAERRKQPLNDYCRQLIRLPPKISDSPFVMDFFEVTEDDLNPVKEPEQMKPKGEGPVGSVISDPVLLDRYVAVADYIKQETNHCSLEAGQVVEVVEKNQHGWWFVTCTDTFSEGWVPANYLEPIDKEREDEEGLNEVLISAENHITTNAHAAQGQDEISFEKGVIVKVLEKRLDGWWKVDYGGRVGFAPAIFLQRYNQEVDESSKSTAIYMVPSVLDVQRSVGGASGKGEGPTAKPRVGKVNEKLQKPKSVESLSSSSRLETQTVSSSPKLRQTGSSSVTRSAAMATANVSSLSKAPTSPTHKSSKPQRPPQPFIKQSSHEEIYSTIKLPPPRKSSIKRKKMEPPRPKPHPKPLHNPAQQQEAGTDGDPVKHFYDEIDDFAPEYYHTISDFKCQAGDGLSFDAGAVVELITRNSSGWWYVLFGDTEGWVPSSYLQRCGPPKSPSRLPSTQHQDNGFAAALNERITGENSPAAAKKTAVHDHDDEQNAAVNKVMPARSMLRSGRENPNSQSSKQENVSCKEPRSTPRTETASRREPPSAPKTETASRRETPSAPKTETASRREPPSTPKTETASRREPPSTPRTETAPCREPPSAPKTETASRREPPSAPKTETAPRREPPSTSRTNPKHTIAIQGRVAKPPLPATKPNTVQAEGNPSQTSKPAVGSKPKLPHRPSSGTTVGQPSQGLPPRPPRTAVSNATEPSGNVSTELAAIFSKRRDQSEAVDGNASMARPPPRPTPVFKSTTGSGSKPSRPVTRPSTTPGPKSPQHTPSQRGGAKVPPPKPPPPSSGKLPGGVSKKPAPPRPPVGPSVGKNSKLYTAVADYDGGDPGCVPLMEGERVSVLEECDDGWWRVQRSSGEQGWAPATFLDPHK